MSLTREQWVKMFEYAKSIERYNRSLVHTDTNKKLNISIEVAKIKNLIQQVIGQQE